MPEVIDNDIADIEVARKMALKTINNHYNPRAYSPGDNDKRPDLNPDLPTPMDDRNPDEDKKLFLDKAKNYKSDQPLVNLPHGMKNILFQAHKNE